MKQMRIHVWHLEMPAKNDLPPAPDRPYQLYLIDRPDPAFARYLYLAVGANWRWYMRLEWNIRQWQQRFDDPAVSLWVAYLDGSPIGYCELEQQGGSVEICYFGLIPSHIGQGLGRALLEDTIRKARARPGCNRVWLHTCSLDHDHALGNYQSRGFRVFKEEIMIDRVPDVIEPWPGANQ